MFLDDYGFWSNSAADFSCQQVLTTRERDAAFRPRFHHIEGVLIWPRRTFDAFCR